MLMWYSDTDEVRTGTYRQLFHPEQLITGKEDAANNCSWTLHCWDNTYRPCHEQDPAKTGKA